MTTESIYQMFNARHIDMRNKFDAIQTANELGFSPNVIRELLSRVFSLSMKEMESRIKDDVADKVLRYVLDQFFNPMVELNLELAIEKGHALLKRFPIVKSDPEIDENGMVIEEKVNKDGVKLGKTGKPRKGYKKEMALDLYRQHKGEFTNRQEWVNLFVENISGMTTAVANTYIHNIETHKWIV